MNKVQSELCYLTIREAGHLIKGRQLSPVELTRAILERIEAVDGRLKSYVTLLPDAALAEARTAEGEIRRGRYRGPLHGIPVAHKDQYDVKGFPSGVRSEASKQRKISEEATAVHKLRQAGSVLLGKLAMDGLAVGKNAADQRDKARNPWNLDHVPGGSSSGSGAALAAGLVMGSLGEDTAGSIRIPAAYCGVVGLKPTYGRVSRHGLAALSWSLDHGGPMARTVEDTALVLQAVAGYDPKDPTSGRAPVPDYEAALKEDVKGLIVGVPRHYINQSEEKVDPETIAALDKALTDLEAQGAHVEEIDIPSLDYATMATIVIWYSEAFSACRKGVQSQPEIFGDRMLSLLHMGSLISGADYVQAQRARSRIKREFGQTLSKVDVLALPTVTNSAPTAEEFSFDPTSAFTTMISHVYFLAPFNITGMPALAIPCGFNHAGLPIGMQIIGKPFDEPRVLRVAYTYQQHARWHERRPTL